MNTELRLERAFDGIKGPISSDKNRISWCMRVCRRCRREFRYNLEILVGALLFGALPGLARYCRADYIHRHGGFNQF